LGPKREDGEFGGAVNRVPAADDLRSNMVRGAAAEAPSSAHASAKSTRRWAGRCAIERLGGPDVAAKIWDVIEKKRGRKIISPSR
jgi:glutathione synthase